MNLAEIKKLKVADLRAKLQERGLDSKGLKADLVERLMSAIEAESQGSATGETEDEKRPVGEEEEMETQGDPVMDLPVLAVESEAEASRQLPTGVAEVSPTVKANEGFTQVGGLAMPGSGISEELTSTGAPGAAILKADFPASSVLGQEKVSQQISVESFHSKPDHTGVASESLLKASPEQDLFPVPAKDHEKKPEQEPESEGALVESSPPEDIRREQQRSNDQPELQAAAYHQAAGPRTGVTASPGSEPPCPEVQDGDEPAGVECAESRSGVEEEEGLNGGAGRRGEDAEAEKGSEEETGSEPEKGEQQNRSAGQHASLFSFPGKIVRSYTSVPSPAQKDQILQQATQCLSELIRIAARRRRNYILDQANVYSSAQRRKMQRFSGFQRRAVVVCPKDEEWRRRLELHQQQEGEEVPEMSLLKVKVSFSLPEQGDYLEEVLFPELSRSEAEKLLAGYKEEARRLLPTPPKRKKPRTWRNKPLPSGPPGRNHRDWGHGWNRGSYNPRPYGQQPFWGQQRREDFRPFYGQQRTEVDRFYGREYNPQRYRDYYRQYSGEWNSYYQDQGYYGNRNYGYGGGRRGHW
nr:heterogeneous nuclear ribonucleoprotein U-like protein 2 [Paramormyrops kingsleyae]